MSAKDPRKALVVCVPVELLPHLRAVRARSRTGSAASALRRIVERQLVRGYADVPAPPGTGSSRAYRLQLPLRTRAAVQARSARTGHPPAHIVLQLVTADAAAAKTGCDVVSELPGGPPVTLPLANPAAARLLSSNPLSQRFSQMLSIRPATPQDHTPISVLVVHTFGQKNEHALVEALRGADAVALELVAEKDGEVVGHICFSRLLAPEGWWALAPVCVSHAHQGRGVGGELIRHGLDQARQRRAAAVVVVGDPDYYHRFGFVFEGPAQLVSPYPAQYTGLFPIASEAATAQVALQYPDAFATV